MKRLLTILPIIFYLIGCQSDGETNNKVSYEKNYEYIVEIPGVDKNTIYDSIPLWLNSEFPEDDISSNYKAKNRAQFNKTFVAWYYHRSSYDSSIQSVKRNMKNVITDNKDAGIFSFSIENIVIETLSEKMSKGAGGRWIVANADIMVQIKDGKYKVSWENVTVNKLKVSYFGTDSRKIPQTTIKEKNYGKLITTLESTSNNLKECIKKTNNDW